MTLEEMAAKSKPTHTAGGPEFTVGIFFMEHDIPKFARISTRTRFALALPVTMTTRGSLVRAMRRTLSRAEQGSERRKM